MSALTAKCPAERTGNPGVASHIADQRGDLDLFADRDFLVLLLLPIKNNPEPLSAPIAVNVAA